MPLVDARRAHEGAHLSERPVVRIERRLTHAVPLREGASQQQRADGLQLAASVRGKDEFPARWREALVDVLHERSEERRVGKACRPTCTRSHTYTSNRHGTP